jgi:hypothetical protein
MTGDVRWLNTQRRIPPLLGERAGVRAGVDTEMFMLFQFVSPRRPATPGLLTDSAQRIRSSTWTNRLGLKLWVLTKKIAHQRNITWLFAVDLCPYCLCLHNHLQIVDARGAMRVALRRKCAWYCHSCEQEHTNCYWDGHAKALPSKPHACGNNEKHDQHQSRFGLTCIRK